MHVLAELGEAALVVQGDRILDATPATSTILGYSRDELLGVPSAILLADPRERAGHQERLANARAGQTGPAHLEAHAITRDGREVSLDVTITAPDRPGDDSRVIVLRQVAPAARVSREAIRHIVGIIARGPAREATLRTIGREVARSVARADLAEGITRFNAEGLGDIQLSANADDRFAFQARDLVERSDEGAPCFLALSFLESIVSFTTHRECLGAETTCQARGAPLCTFVVKARSYGAPSEAPPARASHAQRERPLAASHPFPESRSPNLLGDRRPVSSHGP